MNTRNELRAYIQGLLADKGDREPLGDADSLDILQIVLFLESHYRIDFADREFDQEDFDSIASILALIELRAPAAGTPQA
jgi:acyl carrier protein